MPYKDKTKQLEFQKAHYLATKQQYLKTQRVRRAKVKKWIDEIKLFNGCASCEEKTPCCLAFHHLDAKTKIQKVNSIYKSKGLKFLADEIKKCIIICHNCHAKVHAGILKCPDKKIVIFKSL